MAPAPAAGGAAGNTQAKEFFGRNLPRGGSDLAAAITKAIEQKPAAVVVVTNGVVPGAAALADKAKAAGVMLLAVGISDAAAVAATFDAMTKPTGGQGRRFGEAALADKLSSAPELP